MLPYIFVIVAEREEVKNRNYHKFGKSKSINKVKVGSMFEPVHHFTTHVKGE